MKKMIKNTRSVKSIDSFFPESSAEDILSILMGEGDPLGPIVILPPPPKA